MQPTKSGESLRDRGEDVQEHGRLQVGDEAHVVLGETLQERVIGLAQLPVLLQHRDTGCQATHKRRRHGTAQRKLPSIILEMINLLKEIQHMKHAITTPNSALRGF